MPDPDKKPCPSGTQCRGFPILWRQRSATLVCKLLVHCAVKTVHVVPLMKGTVPSILTAMTQPQCKYPLSLVCHASVRKWVREGFPWARGEALTENSIANTCSPYAQSSSMAEHLHQEERVRIFLQCCSRKSIPGDQAMGPPMIFNSAQQHNKYPSVWDVFSMECMLRLFVGPILTVQQKDTRLISVVPETELRCSHHGFCLWNGRSWN